MGVSHYMTLLTIRQQWLLRSRDGLWTLKNEATGSYLGISEQAWPGASIVGTVEEVEWRISGVWEWGEGVYR